MESTLNVAKAELEAEIGLFLGWGRGVNYGETAWDARQTSSIASLLKQGYTQFLHPPRLEGESASYDWSFTRPIVTLALALNGSTVALPDDFGGFDGQVTVLTTTTTSQPWQIEWRNEGQIRLMYSVTPGQTGPPMFVSLQPIKGTDAAASQRWQLYIFPLADQAYNLQVSYYVTPDVLTSAFPFAYGGAQHAETLKASCIAAAELQLDDARGPRWVYFMERLAASISLDRRTKPQKLGLNRDRSDDMWQRPNQHWYAPPATYNGASFN